MLRRLLTLTGVAMALFGAAGLLRHADVTMPGDWVVYVVGGLVLHDGFLAPAVMTLGVLAARLVPWRLRPVAQAAFVVAAPLVLIAIPPLTGNGRLSNNPSILPQDYGDGLRSALLVVGAGTALLLVRAARRRGAPPPVPPPLPPALPGW